MKILIATQNKDKVKEFKEILKGYELVSLNDLNDNDDVIEDGTTFKENSYIKAKYYFDKYNLPTFSDDSGIVVDYLKGAPGVYSSRYAGEECDQPKNRRKVLKEMIGVEERSARFVCSICYIDKEGNDHYFEGKTEGKILFEELGDNGFGYDCIFYSTEINKCFGIASNEEKNAVSHRGRAARLFANFIENK